MLETMQSDDSLRSNMISEPIFETIWELKGSGKITSARSPKCIAQGGPRGSDFLNRFDSGQVSTLSLLRPSRVGQK